jgi:hypothetical protein
MKRVSDHDSRHGEAPAKSRQGTKSIAAAAMTFERQHRLRRKTQFI